MIFPDGHFNPPVLSTCWLRCERGRDLSDEASHRTQTSADKPISYVGHRFLPKVISYDVWLYFRFPLSLRMVEEMLAARGIKASDETVQRWST